MSHRTLGGRLFDGINMLLLGAISLLMFFPLWVVVVKSFSLPHTVSEGNIMLWPQGFTWVAYETILNRQNFMLVFYNTVFITVVGTLISMALSVCLAYPLSKKRVPGATAMLFLVFFTMLFSGGLVPNYLVVRGLGLLDTLWSLILPQAISAFNVIILVSFFRSIPHEMEDSGKVDGAGDIGILFRLVLPTSLPIVATLTLFYAVSQWNTFFQAVLYTNSPEKQVLQVLLRQLLLVLNNNDILQDEAGEIPQVVVTVKQAMVVVATVPILVVYPYLQKHFTKGVMIGSIKG